jgi:hypothetical protein
MKGESHFISVFRKCMYGYVNEEQFGDGWATLLAKHDVHENNCWNIGVKMEINWKVGRLNTKLLNFDLMLCELKK